MVTRYLISALLLFCISDVGAAEPLKFKTVPEESYIKFEATQNNSAVAGEFKIFTADIAFDPQALDKSKVKVTVDMNSVSSSYDEVPSTLKTDDWFNIELFPQAVFETQSFRKLGEKQFEADSILTIKDHKIPVVLKFTLDEFSKDGASVTGETILKRTDFGIGWSDTSSVKDEVKVTVRIKAVSGT